MTDRAASFNIKLQADIQDIRSALDGVRGELTRLKSDFENWSKSATNSVNSVTQAVTGLQSALGGVQMPSGGGGGVGYAPSVGGGGGGQGGGGGFSFGGGGGGGYGGRGARRPVTNNLERALATAASVGGRILGAIVGFAMSSISQGVSIAQQHQSSLLYATGMPGGPGISREKGVSYGMNIAEWLPMVHGMRQPLAASLSGSRMVGYNRGPVENLIMRLGIGSGSSPQEITSLMAQAQIGGRVQRGGHGGLDQAPGLTIAGLAGALTTTGSQGGVSQFNMTLQETVPLMNALNSILGQHMQVYSHLNRETMKFAATGLGILGSMGISTQVSQNVMGGLIGGMTSGGGGGQAGKALMYQAVGYVPGMDPQQARLRLERGDPEDLMAIFRNIQSQYMSPYRQEAAIENVFGMGSATQAHLGRNVLMQMQNNPSMMTELAAQFNQLTEGGFGEYAAVEGRATRNIELNQEIANIQNQMYDLAMSTWPLLREVFAAQEDALEFLKDTIITVMGIIHPTMDPRALENPAETAARLADTQRYAPSWLTDAEVNEINDRYTEFLVGEAVVEGRGSRGWVADLWNMATGGSDEDAAAAQSLLNTAELMGIDLDSPGGIDQLLTTTQQDVVRTYTEQIARRRSREASRAGLPVASEIAAALGGTPEEVALQNLQTDLAMRQAMQNQPANVRNNFAASTGFTEEVENNLSTRVLQQINNNLSFGLFQNLADKHMQD